ncbi:cupin domain-containing protein [Ramlibacter sp.]|jgi:mannose-6-phosphate isomerase-like protein (cupin superfamily)|uniref:cupin domain-containing protein n=1 Tax=Ramlibacter sp. TaxID=1917967 RepID=UPI002FCAB584|nr:cupin [Ramlibacter sp.]MCE3271361.1 cupin [Ramlibacter sp.]
MAERAAFLANIAEIDWKQYPGHFGGALSKPLVAPETCRSGRIDHRISCYAPMAYVEEHVHQVQEQVYHVLEGEGLLTLDGKRHVLRRHDYVFVPPGVRHGFTNTGTESLVFLVVTTPVSDDEVPL